MRRLILLLLCATALAQSTITGNGTLGGKGSLATSAPPQIIIPTVTPPPGTVSANYSFLIPVSGGQPPYSCTSSGTLPVAVVMSVAPVNQGCLLSGLLGPGSGGTYPGITVTASDTLGGHATSSPPYTITVVFPQTLGPPRYLGAIQSLAPIQLPPTLPAMGTNTCPGNPLPCYPLGVGTVVTEPTFNAAVPPIVIRGSDANSECGIRNGFSVFASVGGSGDVNLASKNDTHFVINNQGNANLMYSFNPITFAIGPMYPSIYGCPSGLGTLNVPSGEFSYSNDNIYFGIQTSTSCASTACPNQTSVSQIDVSSPVAPVFTNIFDFKNCLPPGSGAISWTSQGGVDTSDNFFSQAASTTGFGQNTGGDAMMFDRAHQTCYLYDTVGNVDPSRTAIALNGVTATYVKSTQIVSITASNTFTSGQALYMIGLTGTFAPLNGRSIILTGTSATTITGKLTFNLGASDFSGTMAGPACVGTPTVQCANIGSMAPAIYKFQGPSWTMTQVGYVDPLVGSYTIHNDKIAKNGSFLVIGKYICLSACFYPFQINFWVAGAATPTVRLYNENGAHWTEGNNNYVIEGASSNPYFAWTGFPITNPPTPVPPNTNPNVCTSASSHPGNAQCLVFPIPPICGATVVPPCLLGMDGHPNWNTNNPTFQSAWGFSADTTPITTDVYSSQWTYGTPFFAPMTNEVVIINTCPFNAVLPSGCNATGNFPLRSGHTYNSGLNAHFDTMFEIGYGSQTGNFYWYSTDHGGQFGQQPGVGTSVTINHVTVSSLVGTFTYDNPPIAGTVNTSSTGNTISWVSGAKFNTAWTGTITVNSTPFTLNSCTTTILCTVTTDPGIHAGVSYSFPATQVLNAGMQVALYGNLPPLTALNGQYVIVSASGLTNTQFKATLPAGTPDIVSTAVKTSATLVTCVLGSIVNCRGEVEIMKLQ